ncbi:MAG: glycosyltransferase family 4 protein [Anaerolineae bacterium]|nr:glycosyltransferase family 4 protein [Anaerolineae bacterium]
MLAPTMFFADYGSHVRILEEAVSLRAMGHKVTILAYPNGRDIAGLDVIRCWGVPFNYRIIVGSSRHKFYLDAMLALKGLLAMFQVKPDIIHAHLHEGALIGAVLSKLWRVPMVFDFQGSLTGEMIDHHFLKPDSVFSKFFLWFEECIDHWADVIVTSSHNATSLLHSRFGRSNGSVYTISDCVNPDVFRPGVIDAQERIQERAQYGVPAEAQVVVYLGLLADYQGIPQLIQAAKMVLEERPDTYFLVFGFPGVTHYRAMAQAAGVADRVFFPGAVPYGQVPARLALGDVAVAPKLSATEGAGKILNYMAMALPVIAFDTPVSREYLGEWGMYAQFGDARSLAQNMLGALDDPERSRLQGQKLLQRILDEYTWQQGAFRIVQVYQKVCPRPQSVL